MSATRVPSRRILHLDVLRAVAILLVLGSHLPEAAPATAWGYAFLDIWQRCGWAGVDLFFALSGYLIVALLLTEWQRTGRIDVKAFARRRVFKIYPPYILFLVAALIWSIYSGATAGLVDSIAAFWPAAVHLQNYFPLAIAPHLWSLAMEEHCYLLMLGLVLFASRRRDPLRSRTIPIVLLTLFAASWIGRLAYVTWGYAGTGQIGFAYTHNRLDAVLAGSLVAWLVQRRRADTVSVTMVWARRRRWMLAASAVCFVPTLTLDIYAHRPLFFVGVLPLQALGFGLLLLGLSAGATNNADGAAATRRSSSLLRALAFVGISSYSTYLWHWPFATALTHTIRLGSLDGHPVGPLLHAAVFIAVATGIGAVSFHLIEKPALAWRRAHGAP
jgi:peptidoglycan/LPS O-acetylase OafA/YrhL